MTTFQELIDSEDPQALMLAERIEEVKYVLARINRAVSIDDKGEIGLDDIWRLMRLLKPGFWPWQGSNPMKDLGVNEPYWDLMQAAGATSRHVDGAWVAKRFASKSMARRRVMMKVNRALKALAKHPHTMFGKKR